MISGRPTTDRSPSGSGSSIGRDVTILAGARLGQNTLVAANPVIAGREYPDCCVLAGSPAHVKRRYDPASGWVPPRPTGADLQE